MDPYLTRQSLLLRAQNTMDELAWEELVSIYKYYIYVIIISKGVKHSQADDISQQVLIELWRRLGKYDHKKSKFRHWVALITNNKVIDFRRKESRHLRKVQRLGPQEESCGPESDDLAEKEWRLFISNVAFKNLEEKIRSRTLKCFLLFSKGLSRAEIANDLDLSIEAVSKNITRVKMSLFREVQKLEAELDI